MPRLAALVLAAALAVPLAATAATPDNADARKHTVHKKRHASRHWHGYGFLPGYRPPEVIARATLAPPGPLAPGSTIEVRAVPGSGGADRTERIVAAEPPVWLVLTVEEADYRATTEYRVAAAADGVTDVTVSGTLDAGGLLQTMRFLLWRQRLRPMLSATLRERAQALIDLAERIALERKR
jgi:hypothetical protein